MNRGIFLILLILAGGLALSANVRADDTANLIDQIRQAKDPAQRMQLLKKLHHRHAPAPPAFASPGFPTPQTETPQSPVASAVPAGTTSSNSVSEAPADPNNPYASIITRNMFGLLPIPPPTPPDQNQGPPPPKITLTGIMTIFGPPQALFTVAGVVRDGHQPHDESYIFTEGEEQDEVEVTSIDTNKNVVTFINHGTQQVIPLIEGTASEGSAPSAPSWPGGGRPRRFGRNFGGGQPFGGGGNFQPQSFNNGQSDNDNNAANNSNPYGGFNANNGTPSNVHNYSTVSPAIAALPVEDQQALIAAQHAQMEQEGNPLAPMMPPTEFDDQARQEAAGASSGASAPAQ